MLAQLLELNGATKVVIASNKGIKIQTAKDLDVGDEYIPLGRVQDHSGEKIKKDYPYGLTVWCVQFAFQFKIGVGTTVFPQVEATGPEKIVNDSINYVRKESALLIYSLYADNGMVHWSPNMIFHKEFGQATAKRTWM